ncbi:MAG: family 2 glycosyl transferase [Bacillaceae bacterium]
MKKYLQICTFILILGIGIYQFGYLIRNNINIYKENNIKQVARTAGDHMEVYRNGKWEKTFLKGVNIGAAKPGYFPGEFGITKEDYIRWFKQIKKMNANVIRVYTLQMPVFYEAVFEFNQHRVDPLYVIHGVWVDEETMLEELNGFSPKVIDTFKTETSRIIDVIHGNAQIEKVVGRGYGKYKKDISPYVIGYILGIEWDPYFAKGTNEKNKGMADFNGKWLYTENADPIEIFLAHVGNFTIEYETTTYGMQKPVAFTNWLPTDVIDHKNEVEEENRIVNIDTEKIKKKDGFMSGLFASYHIYPYYPDFLNYESKYANFIDENGEKNSYKAYLRDLKSYHSVPVIVSEFGVPTSRGITHEDLSRGFNQGMITEQEQGEMNKAMLEDIYEEGYCGALVFSWQDEWFKRTWNTMDMDDPHGRAYWGDRMTNEEYFGLLSFDPGERKSIVYVDGNTREWKKKDLISEDTNIKLFMKSDETDLYFRIYKKDLDLNKEDLLIPVDITPKSGTNTIKEANVTFNRNADFVIRINNKLDATMLVQDYYHTDVFLFDHRIGTNKRSNQFEVSRQTILGKTVIPNTGEVIEQKAVEVGRLIEGNGNPKRKGYNSLVDFNVNKDNIEIRIPWLMLNVSNPAQRLIIDDFNVNNGIEHIEIENIHAGAYVLKNNEVVEQAKMKSYTWEKWEMPTYHERLKSSYYIMKEAFKNIK